MGLGSAAPQEYFAPIWSGGVVPYDAFISYSHTADVDVAPALRDGLQRMAKPWNKRRALSVFLDQSSLEVTAGLKESLRAKLADSEWLVLLLSVESAQSPWVNQEIAQWMTSKSKHRIALVLTSGEIVWNAATSEFDRERSTAVPDGLRALYDGQEDEPLYLDMRWTGRADAEQGGLELRNPRFRDAVATLAAPIHGIPKDELEGEDLRQHRRSVRLRRAAVSGLAVLTAAAVVASVVALFARADAKAEANTANARRLAAAASEIGPQDRTLAILLSLESLQTSPTSEGFQSLGAVLFDVRTPVGLPLEGHTGTVTDLNFDSDGARLVTASDDGTVRIWDPSTGESLRTIDLAAGRPAPEMATGASFSPDGSMLATGGFDGTMRLWRTDNGSLEHDLKAPLDWGIIEVGDVQWTEDGRSVVFAAHPYVVIGDTTTGSLKSVDGWTRSVSAASGLIATAGTTMSAREPGPSPEVQLTSISTGQPVRSLPPLAGDVDGIEFSDDGSHLVATSADAAELAVFSSATGERIMEADNFTSGVAALSTSGSMIAYVAVETIDVWRTSSPQRLRELQTQQIVGALEFSPDESLLAAHHDGGITVWDLGSGSVLAEVRSESTWDMAFSPGSSLLASSDATGAFVWNLRTPSAGMPAAEHAALDVERQDPADEEEGTRTVVSPSGSMAAVVDEYCRVDVLSRPDSEVIQNLAREIQDPATQQCNLNVEALHLSTVAFSPDERLLAVSLVDRSIRVWEIATGDEHAALRGHVGFVSSLAFNSDGSVLASADDSGSLHLWQAGSWTKSRSMSAPGFVTSLSFDTTGEFLVSAHVSFTADERQGTHLWDTASGNLVATLTEELAIEGVEFSGDSSLIHGRTADGDVYVWPAPPAWVDAACDVVGRNLTVTEWREFVSVDEGSFVRHCVEYPAGADAPGDAGLASYDESISVALPEYAQPRPLEYRVEGAADTLVTTVPDTQSPPPVTTLPSATTQPPSAHASDTRIAFHSNRDGNYEVYVMDVDGSNQTRLTNHPADDYSPEWSPDGTKIVFHSTRDPDIPFAIHVMDADGTNPTLLAEGVSAAWSPDETKIAFVHERDIYVMTADGANQTRLTTDPGIDGNATWSPDGTKIAFHSDRNGNFDVYVMDADGSNQARLTDDPGNDHPGAWSPDGTKIAFHSDRDGNFEIYIMDADGSAQIRLTENQDDDHASGWSPDGSRIAFHSNRDGGDWDVYVMDADGSNQTRLTSSPAEDYSPAWFPSPAG